LGQMKNSAAILMGLFLMVMAFAGPSNTVILDYEDFGPPSLA
jgi:hypothetical protein